jgi:hypothetical protein
MIRLNPFRLHAQRRHPPGPRRLAARPAYLMRRFDSRPARVAAAACTAAALLAALVVISRDQGYPAAKVRLRAGLVWLASNQVGQLTLVDGSTAGVAAGISVSPPGHTLRVTQRGSDGYAVDQSDGSIVRVDAATLHVVRHPALRSGDVVELLPGREEVFLLDAAGLLTTAAPDTLQSPGPPLALPAVGAIRVSSELRDSVVDGEGHLWTFYPRRGDLIWSDGRSVSVRHQVASPMARLAVADGHAVLIDPGTGRAALLTATLADWKQQTFSLAPRSAGRMTVTGAAKESRLYLLDPVHGTLSSCYLHAGTCQTLIDLGPRSQLGAAVESPDRIMLPDYASGRVHILDHTGSIVAQPQVMHPGRSFELLVHDGITFYNNPDSDQAGVIEHDGRVRPLSKYRHDGNHQAGPTPHKTKPTTHTPTPNGGQQTRSSGTAINPTSDSTSSPGTTKASAGTGQTSGPGGTGTGGNTAGTGGSTGGPGQRNGPPKIVRLNVTPTRPQVSQPVHFNAELTGQPPEHWHWTVVRLPGNNPETDSDQPTFQHLFTVHATYQVTLVVARGSTEDRKSTTFTVTPPARRLNCGDVITEDTVLASDLTCAGNGLTIGADGVTLDLGGHMITGSGTGTGIVVAAGSATLLGGTVQEFATGILSSATSIDIGTINLRANNPTGNALDYDGTGDRNFTITDSNIQWNGSVFQIPFKAGSRLGAVAIIRTAITGGATVRIGYGDFLIADSTLTDVALLGEGSSGEGGLRLVGNTLTHSTVGVNDHNVLLRDNRITGADTPIGMLSSDDYQVIDNVFEANRGPIRIGQAGQRSPRRIQFTGNIFRDNGDGAISVSAAGEVDISGNAFLDNGAAAVWMFLEAIREANVSGNMFRNNGSAGLYAGGGNPWRKGKIINNRFENNGHNSGGLTDSNGSAVNDGLHITAATGSDIEVTGNHTRNNADFGIEAVPLSVYDGGGNTSIGDPSGCLGVVCG